MICTFWTSISQRIMLDFLLPAFAPHLKTAVPRLRPRCKKPRLLGPQHPPQRRAQSSLPERASQKPYYVTTPIFYVNAGKLSPYPI